MSKENSEIIYHYTSVESFFQILKNKYLFQNSLTEMNDRYEGRLFKDLINMNHSIIEQKLGGEISKKKIGEILTVITSIFSKMETTITCFSKERDLLSQWIAYGDNGKGVAIGFCRETLLSCLKEKYSTFLLEEVDYDRDKQMELCLNAIDKTNKLFEDESPKNAEAAKEAVWFLHALIKHESFRAEREVRFINRVYRTDMKYDDYRVSGNNIIGCGKLHFDNSAVKKIIIGPKCKLEADSPEFLSFLNLDYPHLTENTYDIFIDIAYTVNYPIKQSKYMDINYSHVGYK